MGGKFHDFDTWDMGVFCGGIFDYGPLSHGGDTQGTPFDMDASASRQEWGFWQWHQHQGSRKAESYKNFREKPGRASYWYRTTPSTLS